MMTFLVDPTFLSFFLCLNLLGVERVGVPLAESSYFATFADSSCHYALSALVLALSAKIIQKVNESSALYQLVQVFLC